MIEYYGEVILKEDFILYHTSNEIFINKSVNKYPMLFCTFHPSEWYYKEEYITFIRLKKDISLFFMIDFSEESIPFSCLPIFTNNKIHLLKINHTQNQLSYYFNKLKNNNFDGWFNSNCIDKSFIEVALLNDNNIFEIIKTEKLIKDWTRQNNVNNIMTQKKWGDKYPISSLYSPIIFKLNKRYEDHIKKYIENSINSKFYPRNSFQILLKNAEIYYHIGSNENIIWYVNNF
jgi:hypothetical protein